MGEQNQGYPTFKTFSEFLDLFSNSLITNYTGATNDTARDTPAIVGNEFILGDQGVKPSGHALSTVMPWSVMGRLDDNDLTAVYQYLMSLQ